MPHQQAADRLKQRSTNIEVKVVFDRVNSRAAAKCLPATPMQEDFVAPGSIGTYLRNGSKVKVRPSRTLVLAPTIQRFAWWMNASRTWVA